jgi:hypothetical protein
MGISMLFVHRQAIVFKLFKHYIILCLLIYMGISLKLELARVDIYILLLHKRTNHTYIILPLMIADL